MPNGNQQVMVPAFLLSSKRFWSFAAGYLVSFAVSKYAELGPLLVEFWTMIESTVGTATIDQSGAVVPVAANVAINYTSMALGGIAVWLFGMWKGKRPVTINPKKVKEAKAQNGGAMLKSSSIVTIVAIASIAVLVSSCSVFNETVEKKAGDVREIIQKGEKVADDVAVKMAVEFLGYCRSDVTRVARKIFREQINKKLDAMPDAEYRVANLCEKVEPKAKN